MLVGYMRVSKADGSQTLDLQRDALLASGVDVEQIYDDRVSGRTDERPGLASCLKALRDGDTLVVWKLDRLGIEMAPDGADHGWAAGWWRPVRSAYGAWDDRRSSARKCAVGAAAPFLTVVGLSAVRPFSPKTMTLPDCCCGASETCPH